MQGQEKKLFRKEALERLSSPERLDQLIQVVERRSWLPLATVGSLLVIGAIWSIFGRIPVSVTGQGLLISPGDVIEVQSTNSGKIIELNIQPGDIVKKDQVIATMEVPELAKQLQQERQKLADLTKQNKESTLLANQRWELQRQDLAQQQRNLKKALERESIVPVLREENLEVLKANRKSLQDSLRDTQELLPRLRQQSITALAQRRKTLQENLEQINSLLPTLKERIEQRRKLLEKNLITGDALLNSEQEYLRSLTELSQLESQLKELDLEETRYQQQYLENINRIQQLKAQVQETDVQEASAQRQYLESLNKIDEINATLEQNNTELAKLNQQAIEETWQRYNQIQEVKRRIDQLELEIVNQTQIESAYDGRVLELGVVRGEVISAGTPMAVIQKTAGGGGDKDKVTLMSVAYFADKDGKRIEPGMGVQVTPSIVKRERYGGIVGKVAQVSPFAVTSQNIGVVVGNKEIAQSLSQNLSQGGAVIVQVLAELETDPNTVSGYRWSSSSGPPIQLSSATTTQVRVKIGSRAPISYVIPLFRSWTGLY